MSRVFAALNRRVALIVLALGLVTAALVLDPPRANAQIHCGEGERAIDLIDYYSSANGITLVGQCKQSCSGGETCTGQVTQYSSVIMYACCPD
jgi:hypothetical protein